MDPALDPIAAAAIPRAPPWVLPRFTAQRAGHGLRYPGVQRHALLGRGSLGLRLDLVDQPQRHPSDIATGLTKRGCTGFKGRWRAIRTWPVGIVPGSAGAAGIGTGLRWRAHRDPHIAAVKAYLHDSVIQRCGDLRGEVGQRIHDGEAGCGFHRNAQYCGGVPGLVVARGRGGGEVFPQLGDVRREIHDINYDVNNDVSQDATLVSRLGCGRVLGVPESR